MKCTLLIFMILYCTKILCTEDVRYCEVEDDSYGVIVADPTFLKDSEFAAKEFYKVQSSTIYFESSLERRNSIVNNNLNLPVLDQRWETFANNHDNSEIIYNINIKDNQTIYYSLRVYNSTGLPTTFNNTKWYHFLVKNSNLSLYNCFEDYYRNCTAELKNTNLTKFFEESSMNLWKLHNYSYFYTNRTDTVKFTLADDKNCTVIKEGCLTIYSAACQNCTLTLTLIPNYNTTKRTIYVEGNGIWKSKKIELSNFTNCFYINVSAIVAGENKLTFWALGDLGYLAKNESCNTQRRLKINKTKIESKTLSCENSNNKKFKISGSFSKIKKPVSPLYSSSFNPFYIVLIVLLTLMIIITGFWLIYKKRKERDFTLNYTRNDAQISLLSPNDQYVSIENGHYTWLPVKTGVFFNYLQYVFITDTEGNFLERQYSCLPTGYLKSAEVGQMMDNIKKNRYPKIYPYDENRIVLNKSLGDTNNLSDYINASYIKGLYNKTEYIATQNPLEHTTIDFFRMLWQENVEYIVMISSSDDKYYQYWPDEKKYKSYNDIDVLTDTVTFCEFFYRRILTVRRCGQTKEINQLHFNSWPMEMLSSNIFLNFMNLLLKIPHSSNSIVFHCSAGIGRSATILLCDIALRSAALTGKINLFEITKTLREYRINMVHTMKQYQLAHLIIYESLNYQSIATEINTDFASHIARICEGNNIKKIWSEYLENSKWLYEAIAPFKYCDSYPKKNRYNDKNSLPVEHSRVALKYKKPDYIHAMYVYDYYQETNYIVAQQPLPSTLSNFWIMILQNNIKIIINLNETETFRKDITFFPTANNKFIKIEGNIVIKFIAEEENFNYHKLDLGVFSNDKLERNISLINVKNWPKLKLIPESTDVILSVWEVTRGHKKSKIPILVCCDDGITSSSLVVCFFYMVEKMLQQKECDVVGAVRAVRRTHTNFIKLEQFAFLHHCALAFFQNCYKLYVD